MAFPSTSGLVSTVLGARNVMHRDPTFVLACVLLLSTFGIALERRTVVGKALSVSYNKFSIVLVVSMWSGSLKLIPGCMILFIHQAPLATMALALAVANLGLMPFTSPVCKYNIISVFSIKLLCYAIQNLSLRSSASYPKISR